MAESGSVSQRNGFGDPDSHQNFMDPPEGHSGHFCIPLCDLYPLTAPTLFSLSSARCYSVTGYKSLFNAMYACLGGSEPWPPWSRPRCSSLALNPPPSPARSSGSGAPGTPPHSRLQQPNSIRTFVDTINVDPHWFQCGSTSSFLISMWTRLRIQRIQTNADSLQTSKS